MKIICKPTKSYDIKLFDENLELKTTPEGRHPLGHWRGVLRFTKKEAEIVNSMKKEVYYSAEKVQFVGPSIEKLLALELQFGLSDYFAISDGRLTMYPTENSEVVFGGWVEPHPIYVLIAYNALNGNWSELEKLFRQLNIWFYAFSNQAKSRPVKGSLSVVFKEIKETGDWKPNIPDWF